MHDLIKNVTTKRLYFLPKSISKNMFDEADYLKAMAHASL